MSATPVLCILGPVTVHIDGHEAPVPAKLDRAVLVHLLLVEGRALSVDQLTDAVWGQCPPRQAKNALQVKISRVRAVLGEYGRGLTYGQGAYSLSIADDDVDARIFSRLVRDAVGLVSDGRADVARDALEHALSLWRGDPLGELDDHPRLVATRLRLEEEWATAQELLAEIAMGSAAVLTEPIARLRKVLDRHPLRPRARLLLIQALERSGRRAEALAVYDAGRRVLADETGLAPPAELQDAFHSLLDAERQASSRLADFEVTQSAPHGAIETARWLAVEGDMSAAVSLALRGSWWWWFGGNRSAGRDLLEALIDHEASTELDPHDALRVSAWLSVFQAVEASAERALRAGETALEQARRNGWSRHEALAAVLLAERLFQRGDRGRAHKLLRAGRLQFAHDHDEWGLALTDVVDAKATLLAGDVVTADRRANVLLRAFDELGDPAGQIMALDLAGYCAEIQGDLVASSKIHRRALDLARRTKAPEWEASQLTRLGSVLALSGSSEAVSVLEDAVALSRGIQSGASLALAENGLGLGATFADDVPRALEAHTRALEWYELQESPAGISYSAGRLALTATEAPTAIGLAHRATELALQTGDPRAIAHGLEAIACVVPDPIESARALGAARTLRRATRAPLPPALSSALFDTEKTLQRKLGDKLVDELRRGAQDARRRLAVAQDAAV